MYKSDITRFIDQIKQDRPQIEVGQREGRALLWERQQDQDFRQRNRDSHVPRFSYVYWPRKYT